MRQPEKEISLAVRCEQIVDKLGHALDLEPREIEREMDQIQRDLARLRDALIDSLRQPPIAPAPGPRAPALERVNAALSLVIGVQYPVTGIQRSALEQARDTLDEILSAGHLKNKT